VWRKKSENPPFVSIGEDMVELRRPSKEEGLEIAILPKTKVPAIDMQSELQDKKLLESLQILFKECEGAPPAPMLVSNAKVQATIVGASVGSVVLGSASGAIGSFCGAVAGATIGVIPALFTFGLSIPVGAVVGGATGLCAGATAGGSIGLVGGGACGYGSYTYKKELQEGATMLLEILGSLTTRQQLKVDTCATGETL